MLVWCVVWISLCTPAVTPCSHSYGRSLRSCYAVTLQGHAIPIRPPHSHTATPFLYGHPIPIRPPHSYTATPFLYGHPIPIRPPHSYTATSFLYGHPTAALYVDSTQPLYPVTPYGRAWVTGTLRKRRASTGPPAHEPFRTPDTFVGGRVVIRSFCTAQCTRGATRGSAVSCGP